MAQEPKKSMSLESALDEERREVMKILEGKSSAPGGTAQRREAATSPTPPIRSMLDISSPAARNPPTANNANGVGAATGSAANQLSAPAIRSMLDPSSPADAIVVKGTQSAVTSPVTEAPPPASRNRSSSDASNTPSEGLRKIADRQGIDIGQDYKFGMLPSIPNQALPKRVSQAGKPLLSSSAMAAAMSGELGRGRDSGRHNYASAITNKSRSPSSRLPGRSESPSLLSPTSNNTVTYTTDSGKVIDMDKAYRRLSDVAFRKIGSSLAPKPKSSVKHPEGQEDDNSPDPSARLAMDEESGLEHTAGETSDDEAVSSEDEARSEISRGRGRSRRSQTSGTTDGEWEDEEGDKDKGGLETAIGMGRGNGPRKVKSLLAAAEEERVVVSAKAKSKSGAEPTISVTGPTGDKMIPKKSGVHPITSFDHTESAYNSEATTDTEGDLSDIKRAQKLSINMSHVDTTVSNRAIRTILRGDFATMEQEAEEGLRRQRLYLVATDLSDEAVYALEWTIGTILRDGDTLFAIYAQEEEPGTGKAGDNDQHYGEGTKVAHEAVSTMTTLTEKARTNPVINPSPLVPHGYLPATDAGSRATSVDSRHVGKTDSERLQAIESISQTCVRLLRKTRLQVRVAIEVIHCKSPKHLLTEAIDTLSPTLVILGSRGRSALKGVLLGSFSNYLVTKSSVPVMVARKKLRKHAKYKPGVAGSGLRLSNNLLTQKRVRGLASAKID
ncbi:putative universal stress protein family domain protein [Phaeomoniella chlamydospora]|uniref:Putative universal stress protein family domain protein n=1 Tax=Phaeomoniella chlamydospora TaxID=158046 RepID=A0A0G2FZ14_PHACM|nr:putative universal stress protein family domain protein [Phaeomoniella chlamydospora]